MEEDASGCGLYDIRDNRCSIIQRYEHERNKNQKGHQDRNENDRYCKHFIVGTFCVFIREFLHNEGVDEKAELIQIGTEQSNRYSNGDSCLRLHISKQCHRYSNGCGNGRLGGHLTSRRKDPHIDQLNRCGDNHRFSDTAEYETDDQSGHHWGKAQCRCGTSQK